MKKGALSLRREEEEINDRGSTERERGRREVGIS